MAKFIPLWKFIALSLAGAAMSLAALSAQAHHSFAMFDREKTVEIQGTVKQLELVNPHGWLQVAVADAQGQVSVWSMEMGGAGQLTRQGWTPDAVKPGDKVTVSIHPLKDGSYGGQLVAVRLADGRQLGNGGPGGPPPRG